MGLQCCCISINSWLNKKSNDYFFLTAVGWLQSCLRKPWLWRWRQLWSFKLRKRSRNSNLISLSIHSKNVKMQNARRTFQNFRLALCKGMRCFDSSHSIKTSRSFSRCYTMAPLQERNFRKLWWYFEYQSRCILGWRHINILENKECLGNNLGRRWIYQIKTYQYLWNVCWQISMGLLICIVSLIISFFKF